MKKNRACLPHNRPVDPAIDGQKNDGGTKMDTDVSGQTRAAVILARLDRLPATPHVWRLITLLSLGGMFELYDLFMTAYVVPGLMKAGLLTNVKVSIFAGPALFVAGGRSDYLRPEHEQAIRRLFPKAQIAEIDNAGHWVHAEQPAAFLSIVAPFLGE